MKPELCVCGTDPPFGESQACRQTVICTASHAAAPETGAPRNCMDTPKGFPPACSPRIWPDTCSNIPDVYVRERFGAPGNGAQHTAQFCPAKEHKMCRSWTFFNSRRNPSEARMSQPSIISLLIGVVPCLIPPYAFRLSRIFGTRRVGWMLFATFTLLAALQLVRAWGPSGLGLNPELTLDLLNFLVPALLLIGMVHIEMLFKERLRLEQEERRLRQNLEETVRERTSELNQANEELQREISLRKQGEAELKKSK